MVLATAKGRTMVLLICAPGTPTQLKAHLENKHFDTGEQPHPNCVVKLSKNRSSTNEIMKTYLPVEDSTATATTKGWCQYPMIQDMDQAGVPSSDRLDQIRHI